MQQTSNGKNRINEHVAALSVKLNDINYANESNLFTSTGVIKHHVGVKNFKTT